MIMGLRGHNTKPYCNYCNIRGCSNGKHIYCPLQSPRDISDTSNNSRNYVASELPLRSHQEDNANAMYLCDHNDLEFIRSTGIKKYSLFWDLQSLNWPWYVHI